MKNNNIEPETLLQQSLINGVDIGIVIANQDEVIEWANDYFCELMGEPIELLTGNTTTSLLDIDPLIPERGSFRFKVKNAQGNELWLTCLQAVVNNKPDSKQIVRYFVDISDLQRRNPLRLAVSSGYENSRLDPVTGTLNRRTIIQELNTQVSRSRRYGNPLSVILLDYVLDSNSDEELRNQTQQTIANCINSELRWVDVLGSLSAGKFLIILPESDENAVSQAWNKISRQLEKTIVNKHSVENSYRASFSAWQQENNADELINRLEDSLQGSKVA